MLKKNNHRNLTGILIASFLIVVGLCVSSCGCGNDDRRKTGISVNGSGGSDSSGSNDKGISWKGLRIETNRTNIKGNEDFTVKIAADEYAAIDNHINLIKFKIKAYIVDEKGGAPKSSQLKCTYPNGKSKTSKVVNEYLTFEALTPPNQSIFKYITLNVIQGTDVKALTVVLELLDESSGKLICQPQKVVWKAVRPVPVDLTFNKLSRLEDQSEIIKNDQEFDFTITNIGLETIKLDEITIVAQTENGTIFSLNGQQANQPISLKDLLSDHPQKLDKQQNTTSIKLKLANRNNQSSDKITLILAKGGQQLASTQPMRWNYIAKNASLIINNDIKDHIKGNEILKIIAVPKTKVINWDNIKLSIQSTNNVIFRINNKPFQSAKLADFLTGSLIQDLRLDLCLYSDSDSNKDSKITLLLTEEKDGVIEELDKKIIQWDNKGINLSFVGLENKQISGYKELSISIQNLGDTVKTDEITLTHEVINNQLLNSNTPIFYFNGKNIHKSLTLQEILGESMPRKLAPNEIINNIKLQLANTNNCTEATVKLVLKHHNMQWVSPTIKWISKNIMLSFQGLPKKELSYKAPLQFKVKNEGDTINASEAILKVWNRNLSGLNISLKVNEKPINVKEAQINLSDLLSTDKVLQKDEVVNITIEQIEEENFNPHTSQSIELGLYGIYGTENKLLSKIEQATWNRRKSKVDLDVMVASVKNGKAVGENRKVLRGNNQNFELIIFNQGDEYIYNDQPSLYLNFNLIQGTAIIKELQQQGYDDGKNGYIIRLDHNTVAGTSAGILAIRDYEFQISNQKTLHLCPLKAEKVEYQIQLCKDSNGKLTPINNIPTTIIWEPKHIKAALQIDKKEIKGNEKEIQLTLNNQGDTISDEDKDILQLKIERLGNKQSRLGTFGRNGQKYIGIKNQNILITDNILNLVNVIPTDRKKIINTGSNLPFPKIWIEPRATENSVTFRFTLFYIQQNRDKQQEIILGTPQEVTWTK
ncbi:MAG: hypothetical protein ACYC2U_01805 [Candidatus Amoebophilus sp.]